MLTADPVIQAVLSDIDNAIDPVNIPYISSTPPDDQIPDDLKISVHSPADINVYDVAGNHTGPIANVTGRDDFTTYEAKIPGSSYSSGGDGETVIVPWNPGYTIDIDGTGIGSVMVATDIANNSTGADIASSTFNNLLVTPATHMQFSADTSDDESHSYGTILIDENGDGIYDATSTPTTTPDITADQYWSSLESAIKDLGLDQKLEAKLLKRLDKAYDLIQSDKTKKAAKIMGHLETVRIPHIRPKKITDADRQALLILVQGMLDDMGV